MIYELPTKGFSFELLATLGHARAGILHTPRGDIPTPVFMPGGPSSREIWDAMQKNRAVSTRTTTEPRFQTVDPTTGRLRPAGAGELYSQVDEPYRTNYGQGGTSGVADYENYEDWG